MKTVDNASSDSGSESFDLKQLILTLSITSLRALCEGAIVRAERAEQYCGNQQFFSDFQNADQMREALNAALARGDEAEILLSNWHSEFGYDLGKARARLAADIEATGALSLLMEISKPYGIFTEEQIKTTYDALAALVAKLKTG